MEKNYLTALAKDMGATPYTHRSNHDGVALAFGPEAWERFCERLRTSTLTAGKTHTVAEDFEHFLAYSGHGTKFLEILRATYEAGANKLPDVVNSTMDCPEYVTAESAEAAIDRMSQYNGRGSEDDARSLLRYVDLPTVEKTVEPATSPAAQNTAPATLPALTEDMLRYAMGCMGETGGDTARRHKSFWHFVSEAYATAPQESGPIKAVPPDSLKEAATATLNELLSRDCAHDDTRRGGAIWEICNDCGMQWADDKGGKPEYKESAVITNLRAALGIPTPKD